MRWLAFLLVIGLAGCVGHKPFDSSEDLSSAPDRWQIKGRLAANLDQQGDSASFVWQRNANQHEIELYGPLGLGRVILHQDDQKASLKNKNSTLHGQDIEQLLYDNAGWIIPFAQLQYWIIGQPAPSAKASRIEYQDDRLVGFRQSGWQIEFQKFTLFEQNQNIRPAKISLKATPDYLSTLSENLGRPIDKLSIKVVIRDFVGV